MALRNGDVWLVIRSSTFQFLLIRIRINNVLHAIFNDMNVGQKINTLPCSLHLNAKEYFRETDFWWGN